MRYVSSDSFVFAVRFSRSSREPWASGLAADAISSTVGLIAIDPQLAAGPAVCFTHQRTQLVRPFVVLLRLGYSLPSDPRPLLFTCRAEGVLNSCPWPRPSKTEGSASHWLICTPDEPARQAVSVLCDSR